MIALSPEDHYSRNDSGEIIAMAVTSRHLPADHAGTSRDDRLDRDLPGTGLEGMPHTLRELLDIPILRMYGGELQAFTELREGTATVAVVTFHDVHHAATWASALSEVPAEYAPRVNMITAHPLVTFSEPITVHVHF